MGLTSLEILGLNDNSITDISALGGLTSLASLGVSGNSITNISALRGLTAMRVLSLDNNVNLTNIQPLLDNTGLGPVAVGRLADFVGLRNTSVSCSDVTALQAKRVNVSSDCP